MSNPKLIAKLRKLLEDSQNTDKKHIKDIRKVLHKLKKRHHKLRDELIETENAVERQKIEQEMAVIALQRRKGAEVYKQLKRDRKASKASNNG